jgi:acyl carrier protein
MVAVMKKESLLNFLREELAVDDRDLTETTPLFSSGRIDSYSLVMMIAFIESQCGLQFNPEDVVLENLDTVERVVSFISRVA